MTTRYPMTDTELADAIEKIRQRAGDLLAKNSVTVAHWKKFSAELNRREDFVRWVKDAAEADRRARKFLRQQPNT